MDFSQRIGLYVHIPFCKTKCLYCDFNTYAKIEYLISPYTKSLINEIKMWGNLLTAPILNTIFFGGGTPSYIPPDGISSIINTINSTFNTVDTSEITIEANPDDLDIHQLEQYLFAGINRISIGVQTFEDKLLSLLGRRHKSIEAIEAYNMARKAGFNNVSIDLMFGLPYQTLKDWKNTITQLLDLNPNHISMYALTLEYGTPLENLVKTNQIQEPDEDLAADMYLLAEDMLLKCGYRHYEISNWAKPGFESLHNLTYWKNYEYLGIGPGAHSYLHHHRFSNIKSPRNYINIFQGADITTAAKYTDKFADTLENISTIEDIWPIDEVREMSETLIMGLRLEDGISLPAFHEKFGVGINDKYREVITELSSLGLLKLFNETLSLTPKGRLLGNEVFQRFL